MILYPAIDLKGGRCVRLRQGDLATATVYAEDPVRQAQHFAAAGATYLHMVDLDGAVAGRGVNAGAVEAVLGSTGLRLQLGGGIRDLATIAFWLDRGLARVVVGTMAATRPDLLEEACRRFPGQVAVAIDIRQGRIQVAGWTAAETITPADLARRAEKAGAAALIVTDIARDGMLIGPNLEVTEAIAKAVMLPVIASGGIASLDHLRQVKAAGLAGAILGRALYEATIDLKSALALCDEACEPPC